MTVPREKAGQPERGKGSSSGWPGGGGSVGRNVGTVGRNGRQVGCLSEVHGRRRGKHRKGGRRHRSEYACEAHSVLNIK